MLRSPNIKIIKFRKFTYIISALIIIAGAASIAVHKGLKLGIDFAGGNVLIFLAGQRPGNSRDKTGAYKQDR
jgi:preprotein translocase subunit SecF